MSIQTIKPFYPIVLARRSAQFSLTNNLYTNVVWDTKDLDIYNTWDGTTYTTPITGLYRFAALYRVLGSGVTGSVDIQTGYSVNGVVVGTFRLSYPTAIATAFLSFVAPNVMLQKNDLIAFGLLANFSGATAVTLVANASQLSIERS